MKLSIIIPAYNMEDYLSKCLDSVIYPELGDYEIIVVNDGSTDRTAAIASDYVRRFPSLIRLISTPNGGLGHARNVGLDNASGEYLFFLDSDDSLSPAALPEIMDTLGRGYDIFIFDLVAVNTKGAFIKNILGCAKEGDVDLVCYPELLMQPASACNKICRRSLFTETGIRFPDRVWFEDLRTMPKLYLFADRILSLRKPWYTYLLRPGSITNTKKADRNLEIISAVDDLVDFFRANGRYEQFKDQLEYVVFYNQFLTSSTRVNLADRTSPVQDELMEDFLNKFPDFQRNPYVRTMSAQHKLLTFLLLRKCRLSVNLLMRMNNTLKHKNA